MEAEIQSIVSKLWAYCRSCNWEGYDPYDALNSGVFQALPFLDHKIPRLLLTQALKRSPVNVRNLLLVPKVQNAKATALFLSALLRLGRAGGDARGDAKAMVERLVALRSPAKSYWCWGYSFPWQTRTVLVPARAPNLVCTCFVGNALLDAFDQLHDPRCLDMAVCAADYILSELYWTNGNWVAGFSYPLPDYRGHVHNANFLAAAFLCRVCRYSGDPKYRDPALRVARYSAAMQCPDGSWLYGDAPQDKWIDNFHTGFNLCALRSIRLSLETTEFDPHMRHGLAFYRTHFFRGDGAPRYFHNRTYPIDIHSAAQSIITLLELRDFDRDNVPLARSVLRWTVTHMWDDRGFFYYRILRLLTVRISYMRWSQAWMLLALAMMMEHSTRAGAEEPQARSAVLHDSSPRLNESQTSL